MNHLTTRFCCSLVGTALAVIFLTTLVSSGAHAEVSCPLGMKPLPSGSVINPASNAAALRSCKINQSADTVYVLKRVSKQEPAGQAIRLQGKVEQVIGQPKTDQQAGLSESHAPGPIVTRLGQESSTRENRVYDCMICVQNDAAMYDGSSGTSSHGNTSPGN